MDLKDRFLKYVSFDTQSDEMSETFPSTEKQKVLLKYLVEEMKSLGLTEVEMDEHSYAMGTIPATPGYEDRPAIGFIAHVDTSPDMSGANIKPQIIENYDGKDIRLNENLMMTVKDFPELSAFKGHTLITTDGTTLLGADDKAGVAEIMTAAEYLMAHPEIKHGKIRIGFTPDEEVGHGGCAAIPDGVTEMISVDMGCVGKGLECDETMVSICAKDSMGPYDYQVVSGLIKAAQENDIAFAVDVYPHYGSDVDAALKAGYDMKHGLIGPGVYASHGYERSHKDGAKNTLKLLKAYLG